MSDQVVELFRHDQSSGDLSVLAEHAEAVGLDLQARLARTEIHFPLLTLREVRVWDIFLPNLHCNASDCNEWPAYGFDQIPVSVTADIRFATELGLFDFFQIWTPETDQTDPLCVGVIGDCDNDLAENFYFPVGRWGSSLRPYAEIEAESIDKALAQFEANDTPPAPHITNVNYNIPGYQIVAGVTGFLLVLFVMLVLTGGIVFTTR